MGLSPVFNVTKSHFQHFKNDSVLDNFRSLSVLNVRFTGIVQCCAIFLVVKVVLSEPVQNSKNIPT